MEGVESEGAGRRQGAEGDVVNFRVLDLEQRSDAWHDARCGLLTGSAAAAILAMKKGRKGEPGGEMEKRAQLRERLAAERLTRIPDVDGYVSKHMERGKEMEEEAFAAYEVATGNAVRTAGFCQHLELLAGCSPDGYVGEWDGVIEMKAPKSNTHLCYIRDGKIPDEYLPQVRHTVWLTGAQWCDFVSYDPRFKDEALRLFIVRAYRDALDLEAYELCVRLFLGEVDKEIETVRSRAIERTEALVSAAV